MESILCEKPEFLAEKTALFQKALDLTCKFKASVFIIVSEYDKTSEYWGSVDFVKDYQTTGLKVRSHDVEIFPTTSSDIYLDSNTMLHSSLTSEDHQEINRSLENDEVDRKELSVPGNSSNSSLQSTVTSDRREMDSSEDRGEMDRSLEKVEVERKELSVPGNSLNESGPSLFVKTELSLQEDSYCGLNSDNMNVEATDVAMETSESESENITEKTGDFENEDLTDSEPVEKEEVEINDSIAESSKAKTSQKQVRKRLSIEERVPRLRLLYKKSCDSKPFLCDKCGRWFVTCAAWKVHISDAACSKRKCTYCDIGFLMHKELQEHKLQNHASKIPIFVCKICDKDFLHRSFLQSHHVKEHGMQQKKFKCDVCGKEFSRSDLLRSHKLLHEEMKYSCSICGKKVPSAKILSKHEDQHRKIYECEICNRKFAAAITVKLHIQRDHTKQFLINCPNCQKGFVSKYELGYHLASAHGQFDELLPCKLCGQTFKHLKRLRAHVSRWHMTSPPVQCEICGKQFKNTGNLTAHLATHSDKKEECPICHKRFTLKQNMKKHMLVHSDEKPWQCHVCGYRCKFRENLGKHMRVHKNDGAC